MLLYGLRGLFGVRLLFYGWWLIGCVVCGFGSGLFGLLFCY